MRFCIRRPAVIVVFLACMAAAAGVAINTAGQGQEESVDPVCILPDDMLWSRDAHVHGLQTTLLLGNPNVAGPYVQRIKFPANYRLPPHRHPNEGRMVTVLAGTLYFGFGDKFDGSKLKALPAGTFFVEPRNTPHFALTKDEVVLQLDANGPAGTIYGNTTSDQAMGAAIDCRHDE
jgi:quercetin dioxygenase-like cupin family protein